MKRITTTLAVALIAGLSLSGNAVASAPRNHWCAGVHDPFRVFASGHTSCPFAEAIATEYYRHSRLTTGGYFSAYVYSTVTHKRYLVTFAAIGGGVVFCDVFPRSANSWIRFGPGY
jgi:hypothetical protein